METKRINKERNVHEQFLKLNNEIRFELMDIAKEALSGWVEEGHAIPVRHFMYKGIVHSCHALFVKHEDGETWITGCVQNEGGSGSLSYVTTPIEDLENYWLSKVVDEILLVKENDPESVIPVERCYYPSRIYWTCT